MLLSDFDFPLPPELIAQEPLADRAASRMLVVDRAAGTFTDRMFRDFPRFLRAGDCLILNNTRVFPSRLLGNKIAGPDSGGGAAGAAVEVFLTERLQPDAANFTVESSVDFTWNAEAAANIRKAPLFKAMVKPGKRVRVGDRIRVQASAVTHESSGGLFIEVLDRGDFGERTVRLIAEDGAAGDAHGDIYELLERFGHVPLPPYIHRDDTADDRTRYQTVFAQERGSVAAPTAGLHFTPEILEQCRAAGADIAQVTLHVGLGTFAPLRTDVIEDVQLHHERLQVPPEAVAAMDRAKRVVAIGTTSVRAIESPPGAMETNLFISPGFQFRRTGAMLTNFHLPQSSLLLLVCAFGGTELMLAAYRHAVAQRYRFFSYGDCMLIL